jgi:hypothetical protein
MEEPTTPMPKNKVTPYGLQMGIPYFKMIYIIFYLG